MRRVPCRPDRTPMPQADPSTQTLQRMALAQAECQVPVAVTHFLPAAPRQGRGTFPQRQGQHFLRSSVRRTRNPDRLLTRRAGLLRLPARSRKDRNCLYCADCSADSAMNPLAIQHGETCRFWRCRNWPPWCDERKAGAKQASGIVLAELPRPRYLRLEAREPEGHLFNQRVGSLLQEQRQLDAEVLRGSEVDDKLVSRRLFDRDVGWFSSAQDFADGAGCLAELLDVNWCIGHEPAGIHIAPVWVHGRQALVRRETDDVLSLREQGSVRDDEHRMR